MNRLSGKAKRHQLLTDIHRMPALLTLSLPLSTDFGNAKP
jgi:hypothetical protein